MPDPYAQSIVVTRHAAGEAVTTTDDAVAVEEPLEIRVEGRSVAITMRTPGHDEELAAGFLLTEGVLNSANDILDLDVCSADEGQPGNVIQVRLRDPAAVDLDQLSRHVFTASSCGLCGKATIDAVLAGRSTSLTSSLPRRFSTSRETLLSLPPRLHAKQSTFQATGGLHAAALFDPETGELRTIREDVGRHNAVDKVIGRSLLDSALPAPFGLLVSGRIAFEIVQKAHAAGLPLVAGISAPTSLAVEFARRSGMTLVGFLRNDRFNVYTGALKPDSSTA